MPKRGAVGAEGRQHAMLRHCNRHSNLSFFPKISVSRLCFYFNSNVNCRNRHLNLSSFPEISVSMLYFYFYSNVNYCNRHSNLSSFPKISVSRLYFYFYSNVFYLIIITDIQICPPFIKCLFPGSAFTFILFINILHIN